MNAVFRLNIIVSLMFVIALAITVSAMLEQATKDINREVLSSVSFSHRLLTIASQDQKFLEDLLSSPARHVKIDLIEPGDLLKEGPGSDARVESDESDGEEVPDWFVELIPGIEQLEEKQYFRYLRNGKVLRLQADSSDELEEVWESIYDIFVLFFLSALLSNIAIYLGIKHGIKPVADFLAALDEIQKGRYTARLKKYSIREINELSNHFNKMAEALGEAESDNKKLTHELMKIQETERAHLARELHDDLGQYLTGIQAQAYLMEQKLDDPEIVNRVARQIAENCDSMQTSFRQLIRDLHPVILEQLGLKEAIKSLIDTWSTQQEVMLTVSVSDRFPPFNDEDSTHIYRILQEALNNISRHSGADHVAIQVQSVQGRFRMRVSDNGKGLQKSDDSGLGMRSMRERACCLGGHLEVSEAEGGGCCIDLDLPSSEGKDK